MLDLVTTWSPKRPETQPTSLVKRDQTLLIRVIAVKPESWTNSRPWARVPVIDRFAIVFFGSR